MAEMLSVLLDRLWPWLSSVMAFLLLGAFVGALARGVRIVVKRMDLDG